MSQTSRWWRPRFRLASLLWLMLSIAVGITAYRRGHQTGHDDGYQRGHDDAVNNRTFAGNLQLHVYFVSKIVPMKLVNGKTVADLDSLANDIQKEVLPNTWANQGGPATIASYSTNLSLVISHDQDGHDRIGAWIRKRREQAAKTTSKAVAKSAAKSG